MFLARKITRAKWELVQDRISADAVTGDLRTRGNSLSFWQCGKGQKTDVEEAALAIAAGQDRVDRLDIVWLPDHRLADGDQEIIPTRGKTPVPELANRHVDVRRLNYVKLGVVANLVHTAIEDGQYVRLPKAHVKKLLIEAASKGRIDTEGMSKDLQAEVAKQR